MVWTSLGAKTLLRIGAYVRCSIALAYRMEQKCHCNQARIAMGELPSDVKDGEASAWGAYAMPRGARLEAWLGLTAVILQLCFFSACKHQLPHLIRPNFIKSSHDTLIRVSLHLRLLD